MKMFQGNLKRMIPVEISQSKLVAPTGVKV